MKWIKARTSPLTPTRRQFMISATGGSIAAFTCFGSRAVAQEGVEPTLTMMGWADYINPDVVSSWEEKAGSIVIYDSYAGNEEMYSKLLLAQGNSGYDVGMNTDHIIRTLVGQNLIQELDRSLIPNFANIDEVYLDREFDPGNVYTIPKSSGSQGFVYDKSVIKRPMETWIDFLDAIYNEASGQVSLLDDPLALAPLFWSRSTSWNTTDEAVFKEVENQAVDIAPHIRMFNSYPVQEIATGSVALAQCWNGNARQALDAAQNDNLAFVYPGPISELWLDSYHMPTGAVNIRAAHSWLDYVLNPEIAAREIEYTGYLSPVAGVKEFLDPSLANDPLIFPPEEVLARTEQTVRNETYNRRVELLTRMKAAAAR